MKLNIIKYEDSMYPEDNRIVGTTWNEEDADAMIKRECESNWDAQYPNKHTHNPLYFSVEEIDVDLPASILEVIKHLYNAKLRNVVMDDTINKILQQYNIDLE